MINSIKEWVSDWKEIVREEGILMGIWAIIMLILLGILCIPILPFIILNEWSKTWFKK